MKKELTKTEKENEVVIQALSDLFARDLVEIYQKYDLKVFKQMAKKMGLTNQQIKDSIPDLEKEYGKK